MKCCNKNLTLKKGKTGGIDMVYYMCESCGKKGKGKNQVEAEKEFNESMTKKTKSVTSQNNNDSTVTNISKELQPIPKDRKKIVDWSLKNMPALLNQSANFIDKPATQRMIEKNVRYVANLSGKSWDKIWNTLEGQESISDGLSEALYHGATLGDMGDLVPFGSGCEFIANIECYKHALEVGKNAPFRDIQIYPIFKNDKTFPQEIVNGNFVFKYAPNIPRGEILAVVVSAERVDTGKTIGEIYDVDRLIEKAEQHSKSYKSYLRDKEEFLILKNTGKLDKDNAGRYCIKKKIEYTKNGKKESFDKYTYENDLTNPYDGADRPEMLRKSAGKSFFRPYMKTRNAVAMADEWTDEEIEDEETLDKVADGVLNQAVGQFQDVEKQPIKDAEIVEEKVEDKEPVKEKLFDGEEGVL